jgi:vacuolar-type H+-ATPase subunit H
MNQDPVQTIKDSESQAEIKIQESLENNQKKLDEIQLQKQTELEGHEADLRKKGQETLNTAKEEAMKTFKKITEDEDRKRGGVMSQANSNKDNGIKLITSYFEKHIVN